MTTVPGEWDDQQRDPPPGLFLLLAALQRLSFRAGEPGAWAAPLAEDPIAFLLDTVGEVVNVWTAGGELVYSNRPTSEPATARPMSSRSSASSSDDLAVLGGR